MPSDRTTATSSSSTTIGQVDGEDQDWSTRLARKGGNPLQRGSACLSCRKRKMKCDATKPICRQCVKANRADECDYDDGRQKSRTQILQEKIAKLEDRIRELEGVEDEFPIGFEEQQQSYEAFGQPTGRPFGEEFGAEASGTYGPYLSPEGSASGSGSGSSNNGQSFSPLIIDGSTNTNTSSTSLSFHGPGAGAGVSNTSSSSLLPPGHDHPHQQRQNTFYHPPVTEMNVSADLFGVVGFDTSPNESGTGMVHSGSTAAASSGNSASTAWSQQQQEQTINMNMSSIFGASGPASASASASASTSSTGAAYGNALDMGIDAVGTEMGFDPSMVLGMTNMNMNMNIGMNANMGGMDMGNNAAMALGINMGGDTSMSMSGYGAQDFGAFTSSISSASSLSMRSALSSMSFPNSISGSAIPGPGPNSLSNPRTGGTSTRSTISLQTGVGVAGKRDKPMSRWDVDVLHVREKKILADIFLPHARQCGLDLSPERLHQRLELDCAYPSLFPGPPSQNTQIQGQTQTQGLTPPPPPPPAHPALANAIYLLACHFSAVHVPGGPFANNNASGKRTDLSAHEPQFLTRALRGIAAALEAGEAAATDSPSSSGRSSRSSRRSRSGSASARGSNSPRSEPGASPVLGLQSRGASRPGTSHNSNFASNLDVPTGLGGGVPNEEEQPDTATPLVDAVQASALLAVYFFAKARLLEGYYHASAAARLAVSLGMHQVRTPIWRPPPPPSLVPASLPSPSFGSTSFGATTFDSSSSSSTSSSTFSNSSAGIGSWSGTPPASPSPAVLLPPARSALEHQERVNTFWSVFFVDRCWSVATGLPSSLPDDEHPQLKISTIWPWEGQIVNREDAEYESLGSLFEGGGMGGDGGGTGMGTGTGRGKNRCAKALKVKAAAFFERAARIASMQSEPTHWEQLTQLEYALNNFIAALPPYLTSSSSPSPSSAPSSSSYPTPSPIHPSQTINVDLALTHTLAHTALIQLHHPHAQKDITSHTLSLRAATSCSRIIRQLGAREYELIDPVIGTCWMCVGDVLLRERGWSGGMRGVYDDSGTTTNMRGGGECFGVETELECIVGALRQLSFVFPVALYQVQKVEQSRAIPFGKF